MRVPAAAELIEVWERGSTQHWLTVPSRCSLSLIQKEHLATSRHSRFRSVIAYCSTFTEFSSDGHWPAMPNAPSVTRAWSSLSTSIISSVTLLPPQRQTFTNLPQTICSYVFALPTVQTWPPCAPARILTRQGNYYSSDASSKRHAPVQPFRLRNYL